MKPALKINNFDLIRLVAALQVLVHHSIDLLSLDRQAAPVALLSAVMRFFPGVPVFFFVSGFLISKAYESSPALAGYARNRALRIYPALITCVLLSLSALFALGYLPRSSAQTGQLLIWTLAQTTFVQFYNPDFMRDFGVGVTVELQFYVAVPILYRLLDLKRNKRDGLLVILTLAFVGLNQLYWMAGPEDHPSVALKLAGVFFAPWFYMFLCGMLAQRHFEQLHALLAGRALWAGATYVVLATLARANFNVGLSNDIHPLLFVVLAAFVFSLAYSAPTLSDRLLQRQDISYGIYIYHMPFVNVLLFMGMKGQSALGITLTASVLVAAVSWRLIERPCLALKRYSMGHAPGAKA